MYHSVTENNRDPKWKYNASRVLSGRFLVSVSTILSITVWQYFVGSFGPTKYTPPPTQKTKTKSTTHYGPLSSSLLTYCIGKGKQILILTFAVRFVLPVVVLRLFDEPFLLYFPNLPSSITCCLVPSLPGPRQSALWLTYVEG